MRIGLSSLAWSPADDDRVAAMLREHGASFVDLAPSKVFDGDWSPSPARVERVRRRWQSAGLPVVGLQSLFFGTEGPQLFASDASRAAMLEHLGRVAALAAGLEASRLVFGSPRQRDRGTLSVPEAERIAVPFFRRVGDLLAPRGLSLCLEPNPPAFGCTFMTDFADTVRVVRAVDHPAVRLNLDVGALIVDPMGVEAALAASADLAGHVHLSSPGLAPLAAEAHERVAPAVRARSGDAHAAIEVLPQAGAALDDWLPATLEVAMRCYGTAARA